MSEARALPEKKSTMQGKIIRNSPHVLHFNGGKKRVFAQREIKHQIRI